MLIRAIRAENFMRFSRLEISGLPRRGLIGIEGPNESGKSTVGELLLFVLFGKTQATCESSLTRLIRWGEDSMSAEVEVSVAPAEGLESACKLEPVDYLIYRQIDKYGTNYVKVMQLPERREVASGNRQVAELVVQRLGLGFQEFQQSFFHGQQGERKAALAPVAGFENAAGLKHLRWAADDLRLAIEPLEREFVFFQRELSRNADQAEKHQKNAVKVPELTSREARLGEQLGEKARRLAELKRRFDLLRSDSGQLEARAKRLDQLKDATLAACRDELERFRGAAIPASLREARQGEEESWRAAYVANQAGAENLKALVAAALGLRDQIAAAASRLRQSLDGKTAETPAGQQEAAEARVRSSERQARARGRLAAVPGLAGALLGALGGLALRGDWTVPSVWPEAWKATFAWQVLALASACGLLALLALASRSGARRRQVKAQAQALLAGQALKAGQELAGALAELGTVGSVKEIPSFLTAVAASGSAELAVAARELQGRYAEECAATSDSPVEKRLTALARAERDLRARLLAEAQRIEKIFQEEETAQKRLIADKERVDSELKECSSQLHKREILLERNSDIATRADLLRDEMELKRNACRLLEETCCSLRARIGPALTRFVKSVLPQLTAGRYHDVKVDSDLVVKVYSTEKNDFLCLQELSGGTTEGLLLALRLSISHALAAARTGQAQFVFLDEPFKMMDANRIAETLRILPRLSSGLDQIFVAQPNFSDAARQAFDFIIRTSVLGTVEAGTSVAPAPSIQIVEA